MGHKKPLINRILKHLLVFSMFTLVLGFWTGIKIILILLIQFRIVRGLLFLLKVIQKRRRQNKGIDYEDPSKGAGEQVKMSTKHFAGFELKYPDTPLVKTIIKGEIILVFGFTGLVLLLLLSTYAPPGTVGIVGAVTFALLGLSFLIVILIGMITLLLGMTNSFKDIFALEKVTLEEKRLITHSFYILSVLGILIFYLGGVTP